MSLVLHLGVVKQPYRSRTKGVLAINTGDVAAILESKYGIMAAFVRAHRDDITGAIERSVGDALANLIARRAATDPWGRATQVIQTKFNDFISSGEAERVGIPGTPTKAALRGVNHRLLHPYARRNARRVSFRDTGLYVGSFRSWVSGDGHR